MQTSRDMRALFLRFFERNQHKIFSAAPLVPQDDPSLLFTNAGMVPFKNKFIEPVSHGDLRVVSCQKCVRAGGKHNDLDNVGYTARHHTFFEMLGNFSFGDYFKEEAIVLAWQFLTQEVGLDRERLYVTFFHDDQETFELWRRISGLEERRLIPIATADNFWSMGDTGPCGPCSEIFYDHGPSIAGGLPGTPEADGDRFVEIWNLVFMQFEQKDGGARILLPKPAVDTGMGLERLSAIVQGVHDNYDTDILGALVDAGARLTRSTPDAGYAPSLRVLADHLRSTAFLIAEGVLPSNEGRGYVLRRILRRAMRHGHRLGYSGQLLADLFPTLLEVMGPDYPELSQAASAIDYTLREEERRFQETLERGLCVFDQALADSAKGERFCGKVAFKLYDTYGFPLDLTQDLLREKQMEVDLVAFDEAMAHQKAVARAAWSGAAAGGQAVPDFLDAQDGCEATDFLGYADLKAQGQIQALWVDGVRTTHVQEGQRVACLAACTPFYGESGGQKGDKGQIFSDQGGCIEVEDTQKNQGLHIHWGTVTRGDFCIGQEVTFCVDPVWRSGLTANHSATHLLQAALRAVLGPQVHQKGSCVESELLRFDFNHGAPLTLAQICAVESLINDHIRANHPVHTVVVAHEEALQAGALALFGEKYGERVRVVSMGQGWGHENFSVELCGGTHVRRTGDIGFFKIMKESGVASGIRRLLAMTGAPAQRYVYEQEERLRSLATLFRTSSTHLIEKAQQIIEENRRLQKASICPPVETSSFKGQIHTVGDIAYLVHAVSHTPPQQLRPLMETLKKHIGSGVVLLSHTDGRKASLLVGVTSDLTHRLNAVSLIHRLVPIVGGQGGGGRADLAQGGGSNLGGLPQLAQQLPFLLRELMASI